MSRVYVGRIPPRCCERDIERFFKGYGRLRDIVLKNGYGFVEFDNEKDADDAVYDLHGRDLRGERLIVEHARLPPGTRGGSRRAGGGGGGGGVCSGRDRRYGPPTRTEYRVIVENLSSRVSWQDLKDLMRKAGEVTYADAHKSAKNDGIVEFAAYSDMKEAIEKFDGYELYGRKLRVYEDRPGQRSRSSSYRSRSNSRHSHRSRSRGSHRRQKSRSPRHRHDRSLSSDRRRSESGHDSHRRSRENSNDLRSRSPSRRSGTNRSRTNRSNARSISHHSNKRSVDACSRSPSCNGRGNSIKNDLDRRSRSRSASHSHSGSRSCSVESRSPGRSRTHSRSASRSRSRSHRSESGTPRRSDEEMDRRSNCDHEIREGDYDE